MNPVTNCFEIGNCLDFDPRWRPFFTAASSASKRIVLILDISYHSSLFGRLDAVKQASIDLVNSLNYFDYITIITVGNNVTNANPQNLLFNGSQDNKNYLTKWIANVTSHLTARLDYIAGYTAAFDVLDQDPSVACYNIIQFVVTGIRKDRYADPYDLINQRNTKTGAYLFTYSYGLDAEATVPKTIACDYNGLWYNLNDGDNLAISLTSYYLFFSRSLSSQSVVWEAPYNDFELGITISSISQSCYDNNQNLISVAGVDVRFDSLLAVYNNFTEILAEIQFRSTKCPPYKQIQQDYLNYLRGGTCNYCSQFCTSGVVATVIFSILLGILVIIVLFGAVFYLCRHKIKFEDNEEIIEENEEIEKIEE